MFAVLWVAPAAWAAAPEGYLDVADASQVGGWARDPDYSGSIPVHIYVDGVLHKALLADGWRPDVQCNCGFSWTPPPFGAGQHQVIAYGIGVDGQGVPDGQNVGLTGSPKVIAAGCAGLNGSAYDWCVGDAAYWIHRPQDTEYLSNDAVRFGVNLSYGGTLFELYGADWNENFITEHGGAAVQLSLWGYEEKGPDAYFRTGGPGFCDSTPYPSCPPNASCRLTCCSQGAHVADCTSVLSCTPDWGAGMPFNPIQAQGTGCGWDNAGNDVTAVGIQANPPWIHIVKDAPAQFTKSNPFPGLTWEQVAELLPAGMLLDYHISYQGPYTLGEHNQEIPALYPAADLHARYYFYDGDAPWTEAPATVKAPAHWQGVLLPNHPQVCDPDPAKVIGSSMEGWVTTCNDDESRCLTVLTFSPDVGCYSCSGSQERAYLTPVGRFALSPGFDRHISVYLFPYRYDQVVAGKTIRQHIYDIAASQGCAAYGATCDDGDPCTTQDTCDGMGTCKGVPGGCGGGPAAQGGGGFAAQGGGGVGGGGGSPGVTSLGAEEDSGCGCRFVAIGKSVAGSSPRQAPPVAWLLGFCMAMLQRRRCRAANPAPGSARARPTERARGRGDGVQRPRQGGRRRPRPQTGRAALSRDEPSGEEPDT